MKHRFLVVLMMLSAALAACNREHSTVTGSFGSGVVGGAVVMADGSSPAGVEVSVAGTGQSMVVGADGEFGFANVPERAQLVFRRGEMAGTLDVSASSKGLTVQLGANGAVVTANSGGGRRRGVSRGGDKIYEFEGLVRSASATELVIFDSHKQEVTFTLTPTTVVRKGNATVAPADLAAGTRVHVKATLADDVRTAVLVIVQNEDDGEGDEREAKEYEGLVRTASLTELVIFDSHQTLQTFVLTADTVIRKGNRTVVATDLEPGNRVHVRATTDGATKTATLVIVQNTGGGDDDDGEGEGGETATANGVVVTGGDSLLVRTVPHGEVTVNVDDDTIIRKQGDRIAVTDIRPGDEVNCMGKRVDEHTILARQIEVRGKSGRH